MGEGTTGRIWRLGLPALALWVGATRFASFDPSVADTDEAFYLLMGKAWVEGHPPYTAIWDVKPPGLLAVFAVLRLFFDPGFVAARAVTGIAVFVSALGLFRLARRHLEGRWTAVAAAAFYPAYSAVLFGLNTSPELLLAPLVILAMDQVLLLWTGKARRPIASCVVAGLLLGVAVLIKQSAVSELALAAVAAGPAGKANGAGLPAWRRTALLLAAAALPSLLFIAYSVAEGIPAYLYLTPFLAPLFRLSGDGISFASGALRFLPTLKPILPLFAASLLLGAERRSLYGAPDARAIGFIGIWLAASAVAVVAMRSMYSHYDLTLLPAMSFLSALLLRTLARKLPRHGPQAAAMLAVAACIYPAAWYWLVERPEARPAALATRAVAALKAGGFRPRDTLYVVNQDPAIYLLSDAGIPTRFAFAQHLMCDFRLPDTDAGQEIRRIMEGTPRFVVISHWRRWMICERADRLDLVDRHLARSYDLLSTVEAAGEAVDIYRRRM